MVEVIVLVVFAAGLAALALAYLDQRRLLAETRAEHAALVEHLKAAATTGRRDLAAAYVDLINAVQLRMPAGMGAGSPPQVRRAPSDLELWAREQEELRAALDRAGMGLEVEEGEGGKG